MSTARDRHVEPERLSAWIDNDLPKNEAATVREHLQACAACQAIADDLGAIRSAAAALEAPAATGWDAVQRRIQRPRRLLPLRGLLAAAAVLALVVGALLLGRFSGQPNGGGEVARDPRPGRGDPVRKRAETELDRLQRQQQRTIAALMPLIERDRGGWDTRMRKTFSSNLGLVDAAIAECRRELGKRPEDVALRASLMAAYQRKVDLLELFAGSGESR